MTDYEATYAAALELVAALRAQDEGRQTRIRELLLTVDQLWFERDAAYATIAKARTALWHGGYRIDSAAAVIAYDILAQSPADALAAVKAAAWDEGAEAQPVSEADWRGPWPAQTNPYRNAGE